MYPSIQYFNLKSAGNNVVFYEADFGETIEKGNNQTRTCSSSASGGTGLERLHIRQGNNALHAPQVMEDHAIKTSVTPDQNPEEMQAVPEANG